MESIKHRWSCHANKELLWLDSDSESRWADNMKDTSNAELLTSYGWQHPGAFTYKFNSHGFRCEEFTQEPGILALGCSFTGGVGLPVDQIWCSIVAKKTGLKLWNLGVGSGSMDSCFRLLDYYITKLNIKVVCLFEPNQHRFEIFMPDGSMHWAIPAEPNITIYQELWYKNDQNSIQNYRKNILAIKHLCEVARVKLVEKNAENTFDAFLGIKGFARDLWHPGLPQQEFIANVFLKEV